MKTIGLLFPIKESIDGGVFKGSTFTEEAIYSDMVALLTLKKAQRVMQGRMYSPVYEYVFEPLDNITENELNIKITEKVNEFIPQVKIKNIEFTPIPEENQLKIKIFYTIIDFFGEQQTLTIQIPTEF